MHGSVRMRTGPHRPSGPGRHRPKGRGPASARTAEWRAPRDSLIIEDMSAPAELTAGAALRERRWHRDGGDRAAARRASSRCATTGSAPSAWPSIQSDAVQLALDLLVTHPDLRGFFRAFIKRLVDDSEAHACGVWLLDEADRRLRSVDGEHRRRDADGRQRRLGVARSAAREHEPRTWRRARKAATAILEYEGDDARLPEPVRAFNRAAGVQTLLVAPLRLRAEDARLDRAVERRRTPTASGAGARRCSTPRRGRRRSRSITAGSSIRACSRRGGRRCSRSATASRATSTTRSRRDSAPS